MRKVDAAGNTATAEKTKAQYVTAAQFAALVPNDGDECYLIADATNGVLWHLRYNAGSASTYKWEFLGGSNLYAEIAGQDTIGSGGVFVDATTPGPSLTVPRAGQYELQFDGLPTSLATSGDSQVAPKLGSATAVTADAAEFTNNAGGNFGASHLGRTITRTLAASDLVKLQYNTGGQTHVWQRRRLSVRPVRIS